MSEKVLSERSRLLREKWQAHVDAWQASGLTQQAYCEQVDLKLKRFIHWRCKLVKEARASQQHFMPIKIVPDSKPKLATENTAIQIKLSGNKTVILPSSFGLENTARLINLLEQQDA